MKAMERFSKIVKNHHQYAQEWKKRTHGKIMGCFSGYDPEEIIYAAGMLPVHLLGSHEFDSIVGPHLYSWCCGISRDVLAQGLRGRYSYLDGMVMAHDCMHMRQCFDSWEKHAPVERSFDIYMARHVKSKSALPCFKQELLEFKSSLEKWLGILISDTRLTEAIDIYNENRCLMRAIYELRKKDSPPITGTEAVEMVVASMVMDKQEHNQLLQQALQELSQPQTGRKTGIRVMLIGTCMDHIEMIKFIETLGATVVIDEYSAGTRYFWNDIEKENDLIMGIARRYLSKPPHPEKDLGNRIRPNHILRLAQDFKAQTAIIIQHKYCDRLEWELPIIQSTLEKNRIPNIILEDDITLPEGQWKTRVEALFEMIS